MGSTKSINTMKYILRRAFDGTIVFEHNNVEKFESYIIGYRVPQCLKYNSKNEYWKFLFNGKIMNCNKLISMFEIITKTHLKL